jgi:aryl-alcohol dehydrogenase
MRIRAAVVETKGGPLTIQEVDLDDNLRAKEILVRVVACGVCRADALARDQGFIFPLPGVLGHEGTGIVERVGSKVDTVRVGDHVLMTFPNDGTCENCLRGRPRWCLSGGRLMSSGKRYDGSESALSRHGKSLAGHFFQQSAFATHVIVTEMNAVVVPLDLFIIGCGVMTGAGGVLNALKPEPGSSIVIHGAGGVGTSAIMAANLAGCAEIIAVEPHANRREIAQTLGATHSLDPLSGDLAERVKQITRGGADFSLVCAPDENALADALDVLHIGGVCGVIGDPGEGIDFKYPVARFLNGARTLHGIIGGEAVAHSFLPRLIDAHHRGRFPLEKVIRRYKFDDISTAMHDCESGRTIKPVLNMN